MPSKPVPSSTNDSGSGEEKVSVTLAILAVPLMPDVTLMSFDTETLATPAKKARLLSIVPGLVRVIAPWLALGQPTSEDPRQKRSCTELTPVPLTLLPKARLSVSIKAPGC